MHCSRIFAVEGLDGVGKTSCLPPLKANLERKGFIPRIMRDPGTTPLGEALREVLLHKGAIRIDRVPMAAIFLASAKQLLIEAQEYLALSPAHVVLMDRCYLSNLAYRHADGLPITNMLQAADLFGVTLPRACVFYLIVPPALREARLAAARGATPDRIEARGAAYRQKVAEGYSYAAARNLVTEVHCADRTPEQVADLLTVQILGFQ